MTGKLTAVLGLAVLVGCGGDGPTDPGPPQFEDLRITTTSLPDAVLGEVYTAGIDAEGGDSAYTWSVLEDGLPPGLALSVEDLVDNDVVVTGTPSEPGTFDFTLQVESGDGQVVSRALSIRVLAEAAGLAIDTRQLPPALAGGPYEVRLSASGGDGPPYTFEIVAGALPAGLGMSAAGLISGEPSGTDTAAFTVRVESGGVVAQKNFVIPVVANRPGAFHITAFPVIAVPASIRPHLDAALARWERAVVGDLGPVAIEPGFFAGDGCGGFAGVLNGTATDDIIVLINIRPIDGPGSVLGQAGPCGIRGNVLPFAGLLTLDADDLDAIAGTQALTDLIVHEIGHVLGYGALWELADLVTGVGGSDPRYIGTAAVAEYNALGGAGTIPVENEGGEGTAGSHWREVTFDRELLTGFAERPGTPQPLSRMSIASFADLGYDVDFAPADDFVLTAPGAVAGLRAAEGDLGYDVVLGGTVRILHDDGRVSTVRLRGGDAGEGER